MVQILQNESEIQQNFVQEDGTKVTVFYKTNELGQKVKVTRRVKATRLSFVKFGDCAGLPDGIDSTSTSIGDEFRLPFRKGWTVLFLIQIPFYLTLGRYS